jgi:hypothetical protein
MIIEIKGLPENQKIKHINVDITFDDSGSPIVKTPALELSDTFDVNEKITTNRVGTQSAQDTATPRTQNDDVNRPKREIPSEMTNIEF